MKKLLVLILAIFLTFAVPYGAAKFLSDFMMNWLHEIFSLSQASSYFFGVLIHRLIQFLIAILLLLFIFKQKKIAALFKFNTLKMDMIEFKSLFILWPILTVLFLVIAIFVLDGFTEYLSGLYVFTPGWILVRTSRDLFLLDAISEEVFNRAFMIGFLSIGFGKYLKIRKFKLSHAALLSIPLFALSHVQVTLYPFKIISYDIIQLILSLLTGFIFAYSYEKSKSLMLPFLLHGYTNLVITVSAYMILFFFELS